MALKATDEKDEEEEDPSDEDDGEDEGGDDQDDDRLKPPAHTASKETSADAYQKRGAGASQAKETPQRRGIQSEPIVDYLKQYEWNKETGYPYFAIKNPNVRYVAPAPGSKAEAMKKVLLTQEWVRIYVPRGINEPKTVYQSVNLNGYRLDFPKGVYIKLPRQIAEVVMGSLNQTEEALQQFRIDGERRKEDALI